MSSRIPKIKFVDQNAHLTETMTNLPFKVSGNTEYFFDVIHGDYFREAYKTPFPVLMTASNPLFTFGGGLDYHFMQNFPGLCEYKREVGGGNERIANICFTVTVDKDLESNIDIIKSAMSFALDSVQKNETLIMSGIGTGIGGLSIEDFIDVLSGLFEEKY